MTESSAIRTKLDELALKLLDEALEDAPEERDENDPEPMNSSQRVDIFKCVAAYHLGETKLSAKLPSDDGDTMAGAKERLRAVS